jgi:hypothetical protein
LASVTLSDERMTYGDLQPFSLPFFGSCLVCFVMTLFSEGVHRMFSTQSSEYSVSVGFDSDYLPVFNTSMHACIVGWVGGGGGGREPDGYFHGYTRACLPYSPNQQRTNCVYPAKLVYSVDMIDGVQT